MDTQVFIKNFGCSSNKADGEVLAGCLAKAGFQIIQSELDADLLIFNTCGVKGPTENRVIDVLKHTPKNKKIIIAGCLPKINFDRLCSETHFDGAVGPAFGAEIVDVVKRVLAGAKVIDLVPAREKPLLSLPRQKSNPVVSIIPINFGCLGSCTYCCVVFARGHLRSYSIREVVERVQSDYAAGSREFWLTSQDTAAYGRDLGTDLAELLTAIGCLPGDFRVRIGMMTPNLITEMQNRLITAFDNPKIFKFLHLPVQSGDDSVLQYMRRFYTAAEFKEIVKTFRTQFPQLTLATDVIVGFPGETPEAFEKTLELLEEVKPDVINVSKFFARPKTVAARMKEGLVGKEETKRRSAVTAELAKRLSAERNQRWVGWRGEVLIDEKGKVENSWVGRNFAYKPIVVNSADNLLGKTLRVKVVDALGTYLNGELAES